jgi:hypothetical protein
MQGSLSLVKPDSADVQFLPGKLKSGGTLQVKPVKAGKQEGQEAEFFVAGCN